MRDREPSATKVAYSFTERPDLKLLLTVEDAAELLSIGRTNAFRLIKDGELQSVKIGARRLVPRASVEAYVHRLLEAS